jgi:hypothetical protein
MKMKVFSALIPDQLSNVFLWCKASKLLRLTRNQPLQRLVVWNEIFPPENPEKDVRNFVLVSMLLTIFSSVMLQ